MGRFQEYKPISFDIPTFTPDFEALYKLQDQKQKRLDDFNNNTDLLVSSIKAAPIDEADKAKKIQDIYSKKDLVVNELLKNPSNGAVVLKRFQNDLKKDVLFGDIYKMNQRSADREAKIKEIEAASYGKDADWKNYAIKQLDNSYGKFYDEKGFGKTSSDIMNSPYFDIAQLDALGKSATNVPIKKWETALAKDPSLEKVGFSEWWSKQVHEGKDKEDMAGTAASFIAANPDIEKFFAQQGVIKLGKEGQDKLKLNADGTGFSNETMIGQWINHHIDSQAYDNFSTHEQLVTDTKAQMDYQNKLAVDNAVMHHNWQVKDAKDREAAQIALENLKAQHAEDLEDLKQGRIPKDRLVEAQKILNHPKATPAQKEAAKKTLDQGQKQAAFKTSVIEGNNEVGDVPKKVNALSPTANLEERGKLVAKRDENAAKIRLLQIKVLNNTATPQDITDFNKLGADNQVLKASINSLDRTINAHYNSTAIAKKLEANSEFQNADTQGSSYFSDMTRTANKRVKSMSSNWNNGDYGWAAVDLVRNFGNAFGLLVTGATDIVTGAFNMNDYSATDIEKGSRTLGTPGGTTPVKNYTQAIAEGIESGLTFEQFLETPAGKAVKEQSTWGGTTWGILNSAESHYKMAEELNRNGKINVDNGVMYPAGYVHPKKKIGVSENPEYTAYQAVSLRQMEMGLIRPEGYNSLQEKWANDIAAQNGITDSKKIKDIKASITIEGDPFYGLDATDRHSGYYTAKYSYKLPGSTSRETGSDNGFATHEASSTYTKVINDEQTAMAGNNYPYKAAWIASGIMNNKAQANDINNVYSLPKGNTEKELEIRQNGVELSAIINTSKGERSLAKAGVRMHQDGAGNYRISWINAETQDRDYLPNSFATPTEAYVELLEQLK